MKCPDESTRVAFATEALDPRRSDWVAKHLLQCEGCQELVRALRSSEELYRRALAKPLDFEAMAMDLWKKLQSDDEDQ